MPFLGEYWLDGGLYYFGILNLSSAFEKIFILEERIEASGITDPTTSSYL